MGKKTIGFIGLGAMGKPMAMNLVNAGFPVLVTYHKNKAPAEELQASGATIIDAIKDLAVKADIVITILPADQEILEVYTNGLLPYLQPGTICIDMTSALPQTICNIAEAAAPKQIKVIDAPVSGGVPKAENGTLTLMVGGEEQVIEECRPILEIMGEKIFVTGDVGSGKAIKMFNQVLNAANTYILSEALVLAKHLKIDLETMCSVINESSGGSWVMKNLMPRSILPQNFKPGFKLDLMRKDIGLFVQQAQAVNMFSPMAALVQQIYQAASNQGHGGQYYSIVSQWIQEQNPHLDT